jgi:hypothetical protein
LKSSRSFGETALQENIVFTGSKCLEVEENKDCREEQKQKERLERITKNKIGREMGAKGDLT